MCKKTMLFVILGVMLAVWSACTPPKIEPNVPTPKPIQPTPTNPGPITLTSSQGGTITHNSGAKVSIPQAAVPRMVDGKEGSMVITLEEDKTVTPRMPQGYASAGSVYRLEPEGTNFAVPVMLTLPIPEDVNPDGVMGVSYLDPATDTWKLVPGTVDAKNRTVGAAITHFSLWTIFGTCLNLSGPCDSYDSARAWKDAKGGTIRVENMHDYESGTYPDADGHGLPMSITYGVCIQSYSLKDPSIEYSWNKPDEWKMLVNDYYFPGGVKQRAPAMEWWLPAGSYNLIEVMSISEVNKSSMVVPAFANYWRTAGSYALEPAKKFDFTLNDFTITSWTKGRPPCYGIEDTAVGTGDVQVTLTWKTSDDIDLYVTDPDGYAISYRNMNAPSGGALDRDNQCGELIIGRPENIFWQSGKAPAGKYQVQVNYYSACDSAKPVNWTVRVVRMGETKTYNGTLKEEGEVQDVVTFTIP